MMKTVARSFLPLDAHPLYSHRGLFRINWMAGAINLRKKHCNPRDWPHPPFLSQTPTWQRHHSIERGTCLCQGQLIHVCLEVLNGAETCFFASVGHFVCVWLCVSLNYFSEWLSLWFFTFLLFWTHLLNYTDLLQPQRSISVMNPHLHAANRFFLFVAIFRLLEVTTWHCKMGNVICSQRLRHTIFEVFLLLISLCASSSSALLWFIIRLWRPQKRLPPLNTNTVCPLCAHALSWLYLAPV